MPETDGGITRSVYSDPLVAAAPTDNINPVIPFLPWPTTFSQLQQAYAVSGLNRGHQYLGLFVPPTQLPPSTSSDEPLDLSIKGSQPSTCTNALDLTKEHMEGKAEGKSEDASIRRPFSTSENFQCSQCPFTHTNFGELQKHFHRTHGLPLFSGLRTTQVGYHSLPASASMAPRLHCTYCGWQCDLTKRFEFAQHTECHSNETGHSYSCSYCCAGFTDPNRLQEHLKVHKGVFHHICSFCSVAFPSESFLVNHVEQSHSAYGEPGRDAGINDAAPPPKLNHPSTKNTPLQIKKPPRTESKLVKHIKERIRESSLDSKNVMASSIADIMFMEPLNQSLDQAAEETGDRPVVASLNLLNLLDSVVEDNLRRAKRGLEPRKPDLRFMVTFSDDEDQEMAYNTDIGSDSSNSQSAAGETASPSDSSEIDVGTSISQGNQSCEVITRPVESSVQTLRDLESPSKKLRAS